MVSCRTLKFRPVIVATFAFSSVLFVNYHVISPMINLKYTSSTTSPLTSTHGKVVSTEPHRHFVYYAIGKTGSLQTRRYLKAYCYNNNLTCVTFGQMCHLGEDLRRCIATTKAAIGRDEPVGTGDLTFQRLRHCCPNFVKHYDNQTIDALVDHFPLNVPENMNFVKTGLPNDSIHFVTVRDPVDHFISYHHMLVGSRMMKVPSLQTLTGCINKFYAHVALNLTLTPEEMNWFGQIANYQSHFMGYVNAVGNVNDTLDLIDNMDVVGLTSQLDESMRRFAVRLNWPETTFKQETIKKLKAELGSNFSGKVGILDREVEKDVQNGSNHGGRTKATLNEEYQRKLRRINNVDQMLFERATKMFHVQTKIYQPNL